MTVVKFTDGTKVDVIDAGCEFRPCFTFGLDRGPFVRGVGYRPARGHVDRPVCNTRHLHGCPHAGYHLKCRGCGHVFGEYSDGAEAGDPGPCPQCGSVETYRLLDVLKPPLPCCDLPRVRANAHAYRQRCLSCGVWLTGGRLEAARAAS